MNLFAAEIQPWLQPPSGDVQLVLFADEQLHLDEPDVKRHIAGCVKYARQYSVHLVSGLFALDGCLCLALFSPKGDPLCLQKAIHLALPLRHSLHTGERVEVVNTPLGNLCLCVDVDIFCPEVARTAALKGADILLSIQHLDPVDDTHERLMSSVWNAAQSNNLYVVNYSVGGATVACPAPLTRARDGYQLRRVPGLPVRFGMNIDKLDEIRSNLQLMENINTTLIQNYSAELGGYCHG